MSELTTPIKIEMQVQARPILRGRGEGKLQRAEEGADRAEEVGGTAQDKDSGMTRKIQDTFKQAALWLVAITATMFIVCAVMGGIALIIFGAIKWIGG